jgi:hypothetical protein
MKAVEVLFEHGVPEERIIFVNLVKAQGLLMFTWRLTQVDVDCFSTRAQDIL